MIPPLAAVDERLGRLDAEILMYPWQLLDTAVEQHEVVHQLNEPLLGADLEQVLVQLEAAVVRLVLFPFQKKLFFRLNGSVAAEVNRLLLLLREKV